MKPTEYLVESTNGGWGARPLEDWLNGKAKEGWRLLTAFWTKAGELFFVFERETGE